MNLEAPCVPRTAATSRQERERNARPLFRCEWLDVVFLHYEVDPAVLAPLVPFTLDTWEGKAYVSLVAFTLAGLSCAHGRRATRAMLRPISDHAFLNVRTYVRQGDASGIYFLAEWLSKRVPVPLGRPLFGLPYRYGRFSRARDVQSGVVSGTVMGKRGDLRFHATHAPDPVYASCAAGSLDEFLLERYTAFTHWAGLRRYFRVWHPPWPVTPLAATVHDASLLDETGVWHHHAHLVSAHHSHGIHNVGMGFPHFGVPLRG